MVRRQAGKGATVCWGESASPDGDRCPLCEDCISSWCEVCALGEHMGKSALYRMSANVQPAVGKPAGQDEEHDEGWVSPIESCPYKMKTIF